MLTFSKYHGAGNDFILIDARDQAFTPARALVAALCDRHRGIGADGLMMLENDPEALFRMRYFNADGGESTMCGNGGRALALFAHHLGLGGAHKRFNATDGLHTADILAQEGPAATVALGMIDVAGVQRLGGGYFLDTGSPHYVEFLSPETLKTLDVKTRGAGIRRDARFAPGGTNVNFTALLVPGHIRVRTFERGVEDETLACGTGAVASALAAALHVEGGPERYRVEVPGGVLQVDFTARGGGRFTDVVLTGEARKVFDGQIELASL